jgi:hypothetical protein
MVAEAGELLDLFARMTPQLYSSFAESMPVLDTSFRGQCYCQALCKYPVGELL